MVLFNWLGVAAVGTGCGGIGCPVIVACLLDLGLPAPAGQGVRSNTTTETFDDLRLENYSSARAGIDALPPTSSVIRGHIQRGAFLVHRAFHLFETAKEPMARLGPLEHGWEEHFGTLLLSKGLKPLPPSQPTVCKCVGNCETRQCSCWSPVHHILPWKSGQSILQKSITLTSVFVYLYNCFCLICKYLDLIKIQ